MASCELLSKYELTLYEMSYSRSLRVKWLAAELGVLDQIQLKEVKLLAGEQYEGSFREKNAMMEVPTLALRDKATGATQYMTESGGICAFLTEQVGGEGVLAPALSNVMGRAMYQRMMTFGVAGMDALLWQIRMHETLLPVAERVGSVAAAARERFAERVVPTLAEWLGEEGQFLCEPFHMGMTTADVVVGYACWWAGAYGLLEGEKAERVRRYAERMRKRRGWTRAFGML